MVNVSGLNGSEIFRDRDSIWARGTGDSLLRGMCSRKNGADRLSNVTVVRAVLHSEFRDEIGLGTQKTTQVKIKEKHEAVLVSKWTHEPLWS